ncbi:MAG: hypothetical protein ACI8VY_000831, partial [Cellvibrionaceae bacterium]
MANNNPELDADAKETKVVCQGYLNVDQGFIRAIITK